MGGESPFLALDPLLPPEVRDVCTLILLWLCPWLVLLSPLQLPGERYGIQNIWILANSLSDALSDALAVDVVSEEASI